MVQILESRVDLELPLDEGIGSLIAQIPSHLKLEDRLYKLKDPKRQKDLLDSIFTASSALKGSGQLHFILLPESSVPFQCVHDIIELIQEGFPENTVVIFGIEHITLSQYTTLLEQFPEDNSDALDLVYQDKTKEDTAKPVNTCVTIIKERTGRTRCFFSAKTHPFAGEESVDHIFDLYRGRAFHLFRCVPVTFNFMPLICFDYVYRDLHQSNIMTIIERANKLYSRQRQQLDLLAIIQCNPKPEHKVFRDVVTGFYGEHLFKTPGVRDTITVFVNSSVETELEGIKESEAFGYSSIVCGVRHKLPRIKLSEFRSDDFHRSPVTRLRFGQPTRLFTVKLFPHHETDPRSSRTILKVTGVYRPTGDMGWEWIPGDDLMMGISEKDPDLSYITS
ncbi:hypothetical protein EP232_01055 [bacterium]|nr:MAG: hypothetical protein EP232_01055 [bacterium]